MNSIRNDRSEKLTLTLPDVPEEFLELTFTQNKVRINHL